jgi:hypothetical protein
VGSWGVPQSSLNAFVPILQGGTMPLHQVRTRISKKCFLGGWMLLKLQTEPLPLTVTIREDDPAKHALPGSSVETATNTGILRAQVRGAQDDAGQGHDAWGNPPTISAARRSGWRSAYARACGTASSHLPCAFRISSTTSRAAPSPPRLAVT